MKSALVILALSVNACMPEPTTPDVSPTLTVGQAQCEREGGRWGHGGLQRVEMCFPAFNDVGMSCSASSQCEGFCEAITRQCSASILYGCQSYLDDNGEFAAICID